MRPSNKRSRSKQNRPRSLGNVVNRVFDSSGPEGKVRGTPQQIIDKYLVLTRDAQLSGDRVAAENFQQHAEHYTRMLNEAMAEQAREAEQRREQQQHQQQQQQQNPNRRDDNDGDANNNNNNNNNTDTSGGEQRQEPRGERTEWKERRNNRRNTRRDNDPRDDKPQADASQDEAPQGGNEGSMLVETPESNAAQPARSEPVAVPETTDEKPKRARKPRVPRAKVDKPDVEAPPVSE